jgi:uncharacterized membrane protein
MTTKEQEMTMQKKKHIGWIFLIVFITLMTGVTLLTGVNVLREPKQFSSFFLTGIYYSALGLHILTATVMVFAGLFQFSASLRHRHPHIHRRTGYLYLSSNLISSLTGFFIAFFTVEFNQQVAFFVLNILWFLTGLLAFRAIRRGDIEVHQRWMTRNYAMTLAAVFARLLVPLVIVLLILKNPATGGNFNSLLRECLGIGVWLSIVVNLTIADWLINQRQKKIAASLRRSQLVANTSDSRQ